MSTATAAAPVGPTRPAAGRERGRWTAVLVLGVLTSVLGLLAVLAPVTASDPVLTWPRAGAAAESTVVPLSPYRPLELTADIGCDAARAGGDVLRTMPASVNPVEGPGLIVSGSGDALTVTSSGQRLYSGPIGDGPCTFRLEADASGTRLLRSGAPVAERPDLRPPQVAELATSVAGPAAADLRVELHTDARYESSPTALKTALLIAHLIALAALLVVAWRTWWAAAPEAVRERERPRPRAADALVGVVSVAWTVLGPMNIDDSWYASMARNAGASGYIGNYIYQFNVTENPFSTSQYVMQAWGAAGEALGLPGWGLLWMRVLPLLYGIGTYVALRALCGVLLGRIGHRGATVWALACAHLVWFLTYGMTVRPEPAGVFATAATMLLVAVALRRRALGPLAVATAVAVAGVTTAPTGITAAVPLLFALPLVWSRLAGASWGGRAAIVAAAVGAASAAVPLAFADATLGDVRESIAVHRWYYLQYSWFSEIVHYANLLEPDDRGAWGKRLPVLLTLALLAAGLMRLGRRRGTGGPVGRALGWALGLSALSFVALAASPTKWVNHFGAVAAPATLLLALALLRTPLPRRAQGRVLAVGAALACAAAAVSYAGPNLWRPFADWGQPFGNHSVVDTPITADALAPGVGPLNLRNPLLWVAVAALAAYWAYRRSRRPSGLTPDRAVLTVASAGGAALMLLAFSVAPLAQAPGPSIASMNVAALAGRPCMLGDATTALMPSPEGPGRPVGPQALSGDMRDGVPPERSAPSGGPPSQVWGTDVPAGSGTGSVTSGWYALPGGATSVVVPATGDLRSGQSIAVDVGTGPVGAPTATARTELGLPGAKEADWTDLRLDLDDVALPGPPTSVRLVASDAVPGPDSWLGVAAPYPARTEPVSSVIAGRPVFADQVSTLLWPCAEQITIANGIAQFPEWRLRSGDDLEDATETNSTFPANGGTLAGVDRTSEFSEVPSALDPPPSRAAFGWGHVERVRPQHPPGRYDLRVDTAQRWGWTRLPTLVGKDYTGRDYLG